MSSRGNVVVTGGAGFIGSTLCEYLLARGYTVKIIDNFSRGRLKNIEHFFHAVVVDQQNIRYSSLDFSHDDIVIHLAAKVAGIQYNRTHQYEMMTENIRINERVIEAVARCHPRLFVMASTACVYPADAPVPTPESAGSLCNPEPTNWGYGVSKWVAEQQIQAMHKELGIPAVITRFFNAIGRRDYYDDESSHVVPALIKRVLQGENPLRVWGTGTQTRTFTEARDVSRGIVRLIENEAAHDAQPINLGNPLEVTMRELAEVIVAATGKSVEVVCDTSKPDGNKRRAPDTSRLYSLLNWVPDTPLGTTLPTMIEECHAYLHEAGRR